MSGPSQRMLEELKRALRAGPPLRLAVLFGSAARGTLRADSDVDVGIVPCDADVDLSAELDLQTALSRAAARNVDLVRLDRAPTLLRWQVARDGILLLAEPATEFSRFRARAGVEHADLRLVRDRAAERFRQVLAAPTAGKAAPR